MIKFEHTEVWGFEHAVRGMRNPLNSWPKSDSYHTGDCDHNKCSECVYDTTCIDGDYWIGNNDKNLMERLIRAGAPHRKFLRQIFVSVDITAPLYWWKEFDTYKVGTSANSCSTMHKIAAKVFTREDFSCEHLTDDGARWDWNLTLSQIIACLNHARQLYIETKDKTYWWQMIQLLPSSYNQKRTVTMTYENLLNMCEYRRGHKLDEWYDFIKWVETLPYSEMLKEGFFHE